MEAMAAGKIVLARFDSNLTGTIVNGKTGFFFTDDASFVSQVEKIFSLNVICISEVIDISPSNLDSSLCFFQSSVSHDVLCI